MFVEKHHVPDIVAAIDFKQATGDDVTFSEVIAYNALLNRGIAVYIVTGDAELGIFDIYRWEGGNNIKPTIRMSRVTSVDGWQEFEAWEIELRKFRSARWSVSGYTKVEK